MCKVSVPTFLLVSSASIPASYSRLHFQTCQNDRPTATLITDVLYLLLPEPSSALTNQKLPHHSSILVLKNMAVIHKWRTHRSLRKLHKQLDRLLNYDRISETLITDARARAISTQYLKVNTVNMERMRDRKSTRLNSSH